MRRWFQVWTPAEKEPQSGSRQRVGGVTMTPESQRIAIAEACPHLCCKDIDGNYVWRGRSPEEKFDPLSDLNAMHEAEKVLTYDQRRKYVSIIFNLPVSECESNMFATAAQRAEAFLRTLNLWTP